MTSRRYPTEQSTGKEVHIDTDMLNLIELPESTNGCPAYFIEEDAIYEFEPEFEKQINALKRMNERKQILKDMRIVQMLKRREIGTIHKQ